MNLMQSNNKYARDIVSDGDTIEKEEEDGMVECKEIRLSRLREMKNISMRRKSIKSLPSPIEICQSLKLIENHFAGTQ